MPFELPKSTSLAESNGQLPKKTAQNQFYGQDFPSTITVIFNPEPLRSKTFSTLTYEGSNGWRVSSLISDETGRDNTGGLGGYSFSTDSILTVPSYYEGEYAYDANNNVVLRINYLLFFGTDDPPVPRFHVGFDRKENCYTANVVNNSSANSGEVLFGNVISGIKGYYTEATYSTDTTTDPGGIKTLFSVGSKFDSNNGY